ncbi:MAG: DUF3011 domain-containing protein [Alphaproteobacteria bacterium]
MKKALVVAAAALAALVSSAVAPKAAHAQRARIIECDSKQGRSNWCRTYSNGQVRMVRQLSKTPCVLYQTWGPDPDGGGVWVRSGCRAQFAVSAWGEPAPPRPQPVPPRPQPNPNWNQGGNQGGNPNWNQGGGRPGGYPGGNPNNSWSGEYDRPGTGNGNATSRVVCSSNNWSYQQCPVRTQGRQFRLERQLSNQACIRGDNWGVMPGGLWVDRGCAGEFGIR